jgi:ferric-dicitrate binding protein FerR (iron transport regulator)
MMVAITVRGSRYQRYQLERLAAWQDQDGDHARYWLSEDAVWQALNAGITGEQMLTFLENISGDRVPEIVRHTLSAWGARFGAATLRRVVLLETVDAATMQRIRQVPELARLLGASLGPARCLVDEEHMERLVAELKKRNIWPRVSRQI